LAVSTGALSIFGRIRTAIANAKIAELDAERQLVSFGLCIRRAAKKPHGSEDIPDRPPGLALGGEARD